MNTWLSLFGGLALWATHFLTAYAIASLADIAPPERQPAFAWLVAALTLVCVLIAVALALRAWKASRRPGQGGAFVQRLSALASTLAAIAMVWQSTPFLWRY